MYIPFDACPKLPVPGVYLPQAVRKVAPSLNAHCHCSVCTTPQSPMSVSGESVHDTDRSAFVELRALQNPAGKKRRFICPVCQKSFLQSSNLITHQRTHTGERPYGCSICHKQFAQSSNLRRHIRVHTGEKPFACHFCGKRCSRKGSLITHIRIHTKERPFKCGVCDKTFAIRSSLQIHLRIHTGERPFGCNLCPKTFLRRTEMVRHQKEHNSVIAFTSDTLVQLAMPPMKHASSLAICNPDTGTFVQAI